MNRNLPNILSFSRILLGFSLLWLLLKNYAFMALVCILGGALTDFLDGYIARNYTGVSAVGLWLDPLADKIMFMNLFGGLFWKELVPVEVFFLFIVRDLLILMGYLYLRAQSLLVRENPSWISKVNTLFQFLFGAAVIVTQINPNFALFSNALMYISVFTTIVSGISYVRDFWSIIHP